MADAVASSLKVTGRWAIAATVASVLLFLFHLWVLSVMAFVNPASVGSWIAIPFLLGPISALGATAISAWSPMNAKLLCVNGAILALYLLFWTPQIGHIQWVGWQ